MSLSAKSRKFVQDREGTVAILFAMALIPVVLLAGGTVDFGRALSEKSRIQAASDAAAAAAARPLSADDQNRIAIAETVFKANIANTSYPSLTPTVTVDGNSVTVEAGIYVSTPFLNLAQISQLQAKGYATAIAGATVDTSDPGKICLLALDPNSDDGIHLQGDNRVNYVDCWAHTNSTKGTAINANGNNAKAVGKGHCAVGGWTSTHDTFSPVPKANCKTVPDPFANVGAYEENLAYSPKFTPPTKAITCKALNLSLKKGTFTLDPGRYCGGIDIKAGATVTLNPGVYYIDNGLFNVQSGANVSGSNVLLYFSGANARMQVIGGGTINLTGRSGSSSYAGFLVIADGGVKRCNLESNNQGGGTFKMEGTIYMPTQRIEVSGNGDVNNTSIQYFGMIAKEFYFRGNGVFNAKKHGGGNIPDLMPSMPVDGIRTTTLQ